MPAEIVPKAAAIWRGTTDNFFEPFVLAAALMSETAAASTQRRLRFDDASEVAETQGDSDAFGAFPRDGFDMALELIFSHY